MCVVFVPPKLSCLIQRIFGVFPAKLNSRLFHNSMENLMEDQPQGTMQDQMKDLMGVQTKRSSDDSMEELFALWLVEGPSSEESCPLCSGSALLEP